MQEVGDDEINREIATQFRKILARVADRRKDDQDIVLKAWPPASPSLPGERHNPDAARPMSSSTTCWSGSSPASQRAEMPDADLPREIARRFRRGNSFGERKSRYDKGSRYNKGSRYDKGSRSPEDRELSLKNLPPVIGMILEP